MKKNDNIQFLCKDCKYYNACEYYHNRKKDSYICKNFHLSKNNVFYPDDVKNCWIGKETLLKIRFEIEHLHDWAFMRDEILKIIDSYIYNDEV